MSERTSRPHAAEAIADRILDLAGDGHVLDVDCGRGDLVRALVARGLDAYGLSLSAASIAESAEDVRSRLSLYSAAGKIDGSWDLVICLQTLENMSPPDAEGLVDAICASARQVILSSAPSGQARADSVNVRQPWAWATSLAERGFYRRVDVDLASVSPWAVAYQRAEATPRDLVFRYESVLSPLLEELQTKRTALSSRPAVSAGERELRHQLLVSRDHAIGAEAELGTLRAENARLHAHLAAREADAQSHQAALRELADIRTSTTWRIGRAIVGPAARLRQLGRRR